jgi:hypothetical protein
MRTTIDIDPHLLKRLRAMAHREGVPFKAVLQRILQRGLEARAPTGPTAYAIPTFAMGEPLRPLDKALAQADALEAEEIARELALRK